MRRALAYLSTGSQTTPRSPNRLQRYHGRAMKPADHVVAVRRDSNRIANAAEGRLDRR
jgi:hypothetical protein